MSAIHNKDYSVVKTSRAGQLALSSFNRMLLGFCKDRVKIPIHQTSRLKKVKKYVE